MILLNHTEHAIMLGDVLLIPAKPCKVPGTLKSLKDKYPALADYITAGAVESITSAAAQQALSDLEAKTIDELKQYAANNNVDLAGKTNKDDIVAAIKAAGC